MLLVSVALLTACSAPGAASTPSPSSSIGDGHGFVAGAEEVAEPPLHLLTVDADGSVDQMDLVDESWTTIGSVAGVSDAVTDGRFVFTSDAESGTVTIIDSGMWTRDHEDHFHYYRGTPRVVGAIEGMGPATISPGASATGVFFPESGESILVDNAALGDGDVVERFRRDGAPHPGSLVQLGSHALLTTATGGIASGVQVLGVTGDEVTDATASCTDAGAPITTPVGVAYPCADGALLATASADGIQFEHVPYPDAAAPPADSFAAREGRPTVAGLAGDLGMWLLDTRERSMTFVPTDVPLLQVTAVDDEEGHVVALTDDGRIAVIVTDGTTLARTAPLLPDTIGDPALLGGVSLVVDQQRAYLNAPAERLLHEIDFADSARIARSFPTDGVPRFVAGTGR